MREEKGRKGKRGETSCDATDIYDECCGATNVPARMSSTGLFHKLDNPIYKSATRARRAAFEMPPLEVGEKILKKQEISRGGKNHFVIK
jgi:hypothetical protein